MILIQKVFLEKFDYKKTTGMRAHAVEVCLNNKVITSIDCDDVLVSKTKDCWSLTLYKDIEGYICEILDSDEINLTIL